MIGVKTARAVVIDNDPEEALPVLMALGLMGVGAVYLRGENEEDLPTAPLDGIRLMFLDMVLGGSTEVTQVVSHLMAVLKRVLPDDPHPVLIVLWTKHLKDYGEAFQKALSTEFKQIPSSVVVALEKAELAGSDPETIKKIAEAITVHINKRAPLNLIWHWEQSVHDAASRTTSALMALVMAQSSDPGADVFPILARILKVMVIAAGGEAEHDPQEAVRLLFETLNYVHYDRVESTLEKLPEALAPAMKELARTFQVQTSSQDRARLNTMILTSPVSDDLPRPGNVYLRSQWKSEKDQINPFELLPGGAKEMAKELFDPTRDEVIAKSMHELNVVQGEGAKKGCRADIENRRKELQPSLEQAFIEALVEFTPICDHAQGKQQMTRLVRGFLIGEKAMHLIKQAPFLNSIGPFIIQGVDHPRHLVIHARYLTGLPKDKTLSRPVFRIRQHAMVALQAWFASHAARPGVLSIDR